MASLWKNGIATSLTVAPVYSEAHSDFVSGTEKIPALNVSASKDSTGAIHISIVNLDPSKNISLNISVGGALNVAGGQIITSSNLTDINTFEKKYTVKSETFTGARKNGNDLLVEIPSKSVVVVRLK